MHLLSIPASVELSRGCIWTTMADKMPIWDAYCFVPLNEAGKCLRWCMEETRFTCRSFLYRKRLKNCHLYHRVTHSPARDMEQIAGSVYHQRICQGENFWGACNLSLQNQQNSSGKDLHKERYFGALGTSALFVWVAFCSVSITTTSGLLFVTIVYFYHCYIARVYRLLLNHGFYSAKMVTI